MRRLYEPEAGLEAELEAIILFDPYAQRTGGQLG
jgi:hypothetical protein